MRHTRQPEAGIRHGPGRRRPQGRTQRSPTNGDAIYPVFVAASFIFGTAFTPTAPQGAVFASVDQSPQGHGKRAGGRFRRKLGHATPGWQSSDGRRSKCHTRWRRLNRRILTLWSTFCGTPSGIPPPSPVRPGETQAMRPCLRRHLATRGGAAGLAVLRRRASLRCPRSRQKPGRNPANHPGRRV